MHFVWSLFFAILVIVSFHSINFLSFCTIHVGDFFEMVPLLLILCRITAVRRFGCVCSSYYAWDTQFRCSNAVIMAECTALLTNDHCIQWTCTIRWCILNAQCIILQRWLDPNVTINYICNRIKKSFIISKFIWHANACAHAQINCIRVTYSDWRFFGG